MNPSIFFGVCLLALMASTLTEGVSHVPVSHIQLPHHLAKHMQKLHPHQLLAEIAYKKHLADLAGPSHMSNHPRAQIKAAGQPMASTQSTPIINTNPIPVEQPDYYLLVGNITAGTPPQQFTVSFDFDQQDLYLIGVGADGAPSVSNSSESSESSKNQYDKSASTTYQNPNGSFSGDYGYVSGVLANDLVNLGDLNLNLTFGDADSIDWWVDSLPIDGVLGLSIKRSENNIPNVQNQLASQMTDPIMVMHLTDQTNDSFISFGSEDLPQCSQDWMHIPNGNLTYYGIGGMNVTSLNIEGNTTTLNAHNRPLFLQKGSTYSKYVSTQTLDLLVQASGAIYNEETDDYELPCDGQAQMKNVLINLSVGQSITLTPSDYVGIIYTSNNGTVSSSCILDVIGYYNETNPSYDAFEIVLDQRFFNTRCVSYNSQTKVLGLAMLAQTAMAGPNMGSTPQPVEASTQS